MDRSIPTFIFIAIVILTALIGRFMYWRQIEVQSTGLRLKRQYNPETRRLLDTAVNERLPVL